MGLVERRGRQMTTIRTERFEIKTIWSDGSTSTEHRNSRAEANALARRRRDLANVVEVIISPVMKTVGRDWWLPVPA